MCIEWMRKYLLSQLFETRAENEYHKHKQVTHSQSYTTVSKQKIPPQKNEHLKHKPAKCTSTSVENKLKNEREKKNEQKPIARFQNKYR